ncbi:MAG: hypothetical protein HY452_01890 [Parcubacteria group bacterium]|nr:hypothetical protein [Parcubacteria group bacterium]
MLRVLRHIAEILLILLVNIAILIPWFGYMAMDFSQPTEVAWLTNDKGEKQGVSLNYPNSISERAQRFYQLIHSPVEPSYSTVIVLCLLTVIGLVSVPYFLVHEKNDEDTFIDLAIKTIPIQLFLIAVCVVGFILNYTYLNPEDMLRQSIADQELANAAIKRYMLDIYVGSWMVPTMILLVLDAVTVVFGALVINGINTLSEWPATRTRQVVWENQEIINNRIIVVHQNRVTEYLKLEWAIKWVPWPVAVLKKERLSVTSLNAFLNEIANQARRFVTEVFISNFTETTRNCLSRLDPRLIAGFAQVWQNQLLEWTRTNADKIKSEFAARSDSSAEQLLTQTSAETAERIKQEMSATAAEMVRERLSVFWGEAMNQLRPFITQNQTGWGNATPVLPEGTRIFLTQGGTTLIVVEQKPQIRSVLFSGSFVDYFGGLGEVEDRPNERFKLAFPYTLFVLRFIDGQFERLSFLYRNQALRSIEDGVFTSNLPNIDHRNNVCLGGIKNTTGLSLAEQTETVITYFWDSVFNTDLRNGFTEIAAKIPALSTLKKWEEETNQNPAFVLSAEWSQFGTLSQLLQGLLKDAVLTDVMRELGKIAKCSTSDVAVSCGTQISKHIAGMDFSRLCYNAAAKTLDQELAATSRRLVDMILANADKTLAGRGESVRQDLSKAMIQAIPEALSDNLREIIAGGRFSSRVDVWDTMLRLVPREEVVSDDSAADTDIHPQER